MPRRDNFADLAAFVAVADTLNFRAAASRVGVTPSALSHVMRHLEERLGVRLLNRTTRSVSLTDAGVRLLQRLRPAFNQISGAIDELNEQRQGPAGHLRILTTSLLATTVVVMPIWERFASTYPRVQLELCVGSNAEKDIVASGFDAGIGPKDWMMAKDMIAVRVSGPIKMVMVGAPAYFAGRGPPRTLGDLASHNCIQFRRAVKEAPLKWPLVSDGKIRGIATAGGLTVNAPELAVSAALDGLGIAYVPEAMAASFLRAGQLVRVLESWSSSLEAFFLYYHGHRQVPVALRAFIDMIRAPKPEAVRRSLRYPF